MSKFSAEITNYIPKKYFQPVLADPFFRKEQYCQKKNYYLNKMAKI